MFNKHHLLNKIINYFKLIVLIDLIIIKFVYKQIEYIQFNDSKNWINKKKNNYNNMN